jgi:GH25 family lysozyme M1 (1,4-beta-N-acetylmuramidase)
MQDQHDKKNYVDDWLHEYVVTLDEARLDLSNYRFFRSCVVEQRGLSAVFICA